MPAFPAGEQRRRLRQYLPGLQELVARASWQDADVRRWGSESTARAELANLLEQLAALMQ